MLAAESGQAALTFAMIFSASCGVETLHMFTFSFLSYHTPSTGRPSSKSLILSLSHAWMENLSSRLVPVLPVAACTVHSSE